MILLHFCNMQGFLLLIYTMEEVHHLYPNISKLQMEIRKAMSIEKMCSCEGNLCAQTCMHKGN